MDVKFFMSEMLQGEMGLNIAIDWAYQKNIALIYR
jgi:hypothetical protein